MTQPIVGISGFGLQDSVFYQHMQATNSWRIADVLLPKYKQEAMLFGVEAAEDRICSGYPWPPEAKLDLDNMRRAPVPVLWRVLVEAEDQQCNWKTKTQEIPVAKLLAGHLYHLYTKQLNVLDKPELAQPVISIPNKLDERGQDALLQELRRLGVKSPLLLWRPVAAVLSWLQVVESSIRLRLKQSQEVYVGVIYLGADTIEMTRLKLCEYPHEGNTYILPRRSRPEAESELIGIDWAANILQDQLKTADYNTFWQCFCSESKHWKSLAVYTEKDTDKLKYHSDKQWHNWNPIWTSQKVDSLEPDTCKFLRKILEKACKLSNRPIISNTIAEYLEERLEEINKPRLDSVIICGPLVNQPSPPWLQKLLHQLGFQLSLIPEPGKAWLAIGNNAIAEGAAIYGQKCALGEPAYLDTLPPLALLADKEHDQDFEWCPLFKEREVLGGQESMHIISGRFSLKSGSNTLQVWLSRADHALSKVDSSNLPFYMERIIRAWVRKMGSLNATNANLDQSLSQAEKSYALAYAQKLFATITDNPTNSSTTPYRVEDIQLEITPEINEPLDVHVKMKPAAGLARVEFVPRNIELFRNRRIRLDFDKMTPNANVAKKTFGWPGLQEILVHPEDTAWTSNNYIEIISEFMDNAFLGDGYKDSIDDLKKLFRTSLQFQYNNDYFWCLPITENGEVCSKAGNSKLNSVVYKLAKDIESHPMYTRKLLLSTVSRTSWLYLAAPEAAKKVALSIIVDFTLCKRSELNLCTEAAARMFEDPEQLTKIFTSILARCKDPEQEMTINSIRAAITMLKFRDKAIEALGENQANLLAKFTIVRIKKEVGKNKFEQVFYQGVLLLLYLLRIRKINKDFCSPQSAIRVQYELVIEMLQTAIQFHKTKQKISSAEKNSRALDEFKQFINYEATMDIPSAIVELAGDNDDEMIMVMS